MGVFAQRISDLPNAKSIQPSIQTSLVFEKTTHDYGTMAQGADGHCEFKFTNTGKAPLTLSNVTASCGCTVPDWPREPIAPGNSSSIKVKYNTAIVGAFNKSITVNSNAANNPIVLQVKGNVTAPKSQSTQSTQSTQTLQTTASTPITQTSQPSTLDSIKFEKNIHDYGTMVQGADGNCEFKFTNTGKAPLILSNVTASCGCTVPDWPKGPILPGKTSSIKVKYNTALVGIFNKSITVNSNAINNITVLQIKGNVTPKQ